MSKQCQGATPPIVNPFTLSVTPRPPALYEKWPLEMWTIPPYSVHFYGVIAGSGGLDKGPVCGGRYKRKGLNQAEYSSVQEQQQQQQFQQQQQQRPSTNQQNDFHWHEHDEQGEFSF